MYHRWRSYDIRFLKYKVWQTGFFEILSHFLPFHPWQLGKSKFWKIEKNTCRYYQLTYVHHKWQSNDVWFLRCGVQQTEFFFFLSFWTVFFFPFTPPTRPPHPPYEPWKSKFWKKWYISNILSFCKCIQ